MNPKILVTTHEETSSGTKFTWGEGLQEWEITIKVNTLYLLNDEVPPIPPSRLGLGVRERTNYKPHAKRGEVKYLDINEINLNLTNVAIKKLEELMSDWIGFFYWKNEIVNSVYTSTIGGKFDANIKSFLRSYTKFYKEEEPTITHNIKSQNLIDKLDDLNLPLFIKELILEKIEINLGHSEGRIVYIKLNGDRRLKSSYSAHNYKL